MTAGNIRNLIVTALVAIGATTPAAATTHPDYRDELNRCIVALRPAVAGVGGGVVVHTVTGIRVRGLWREFTIESALRGHDGNLLRQITSRCQAERWGDDTRLAFARNRG